MVIREKVQVGKSIFLNSKKPGRYVGGEANSVLKKDYSVLMAIIYPDLYEIGMSHLGWQILYDKLNEIDKISCQRAFMPDFDFRDNLLKHSLPIFTLEERISLKNSDAILFTLQYELNYTNAAYMLEISGVSADRRERGDSDPIVIAGGPSLVNPLPFSLVADAIVIGDGEEVIVEIANIFLDFATKKERIEKLSELEGVWTPHRGVYPVRARKTKTLTLENYPTKRVIPNTAIEHDRFSCEIMRGCVRGCRFCSAGYIYRPFRERNCKDIFDEIASGVKHTGFRDVGLLSLSATDHTEIAAIIETANEFVKSEDVGFSFPSLRVGTLPSSITKAMLKTNSITLAVEAGTERLRDVINKDISDQEIYDTVATSFAKGYSVVKLYFMVGLPFETKEDIQGIIEMIKHIGSLAAKVKGKKQVNVSIGPFTPRPFTPFQWRGFEDCDVLFKKMAEIKRAVVSRTVNVSYRNPKISKLEAILSRGDEKIGEGILKAAREGLIMQAWDEYFDMEKWENVFESLNIDISEILEEKKPDALLAWDFVDMRVSKNFLIEEFEKSKIGVKTADCKNNQCLLCGVCSGEIKNVYASESEFVFEANSEVISDTICWGRINYRQSGEAALLSFRDTRENLVKAISVCGYKIASTKGFTKRASVSFSDPNPFGIESECEKCDIEFTQKLEKIETDKINALLPKGMEITEYLFSNSKPLPKLSALKNGRYVIVFFNEGDMNKVFLFLQDSNNCIIQISGTGKERKINISESVLRHNKIGEQELEVELIAAGENAIRVDALLEFVLKKKWYEFCSVLKTASF